MTSYGSFGRVHAAAAKALTPEEAERILRSGSATAASLLGYGNGRSYGDSCLNSTGNLVDMRGRSAVIAFDLDTGVLKAQSGILLSDIIDYVMASGYFPAVVPGTRFVTLGGAIANDIHGKNHHFAGTFGCHVIEFTLLRSDGHTYRCSQTLHPDLFAATIGGMGMTGLILDATIRLRRVSSPDVIETRKPVRNISHYLEIAETTDSENEYAVAWIDQLATGDELGRGVLLAANHAPEGVHSASTGRSRVGVPFQPPFTVLNRPFLRAFNAAYGWSKRRNGGEQRSSWSSYFFPLDAVKNWNRLYGPHGLYQHQSIVPSESAQVALPRLLRATQDAGQASFLTVLKRFGHVQSPGLMSFPRPGYTLTLDFPNRGDTTRRLLELLDAITVDAGGSVNAYKDARMTPEVFARSYAKWPEVEALRDPAFMSDFWRRSALDLASAGTLLAHAAE